MKRVLSAIESGTFRIPFYLDRCARAGIDLDRPMTAEIFHRIPFTFKDDLRATSPYSRTKSSVKDIFGLFSSNGTTGKRTYYVYTKEDHSMQARFVKTFYPELGVAADGLGAVLGQIGSAVMGHCMMWQFQALGCAFTLCPEPTPENILELVTELPVTQLATLPSIASLPAARPEWKAVTQKAGVKQLLLGGDFLSRSRRKLLEDTWNCEVYNTFGMSEIFGPIGCECREQNGFHYIDDALYLEIIDPDTLRPAAPGQIGIGVYTTLWNKGFPLLRYWSGDLLRIMPEPCACASPYPRFEYLGRQCDCLKLSSGRWVYPMQLEDILLPHDLTDSQIQAYPDGTFLFLYNSEHAAPAPEPMEMLCELFEADVEARPVPLSSLNLRGLKPKYILDCR